MCLVGGVRGVLVLVDHDAVTASMQYGRDAGRGDDLLRLIIVSTSLTGLHRQPQAIRSIRLLRNLL